MNFGYGYEREFKTFFTQKIKRIDLKERIYSPQKLKFSNETSIQESNIVANFCATVFVLWCVETLKIFKVPLCVGSVLWCVETSKIFQRAPVCWDFENLQSSPVCGLFTVRYVY